MTQKHYFPNSKKKLLVQLLSKSYSTTELTFAAIQHELQTSGKITMKVKFKKK